MKRSALLLLAGGALVLTVGCETTKQFIIRSVPDGARVVIDNEPLPNRTPTQYMMRLDSQGGGWRRFDVRVLKEGYIEDSWTVFASDAPDLLFFLVKKEPE